MNEDGYPAELQAMLRAQGKGQTHKRNRKAWSVREEKN